MFDPETLWEAAPDGMGVVGLLGRQMELWRDPKAVETIVFAARMGAGKASVPFAYMSREAVRAVLNSFGRAVRIVEETPSKCLAGVDPSVVLPPDTEAFRHFGDVGRYSLLTTAVVRCFYALKLLQELREELECPETNHPDGMEGCITCPFHRLALLLRLYVMTHLDLLAECCFGTDPPNDAFLCERPTPMWPSRYETTYPFGTRCRWAGTLPPVADVVDMVHWFARDSQHRWALITCLQKVCPHKYMGRGWFNKLRKVCESDGPLSRILGELVLCSEFGGYAHAVEFPYLPRSLALWWAMNRNPRATLLEMLRRCPNYVLFAPKEALAWTMRFRPDSLAFVRLRYHWDKFSVATVASMNEIRGHLSRTTQTIDATELDLIARSLHEKMKDPKSLRVLRLPYKVLACKHLDGIMRRKLRENGITCTAIRGYDNCGPKQLATMPRDEMKENSPSELCLLRRATLNMAEVLRVANVPSPCKRYLLAIEGLFDAFAVADTATKREIDEAVKDLTDEEFLSLHRLISHACNPFLPIVLPLSRKASEAHLRCLSPAERPLYVCSCCGEIGETVMRERREADGKSTVRVERGRKNIAYSVACDAVFCNKKRKKSNAGAKRRQTSAQHPKPGKPRRAVVPKHVMALLLHKACEKRPMECLDKRGVMIKINDRLIAACCTCGVMTELNPTTCLDDEPECPVCRTNREREERAAKDVFAGRKEACAVCRKYKRRDMLAPVLVFQDVERRATASYNRITPVLVCPRHVDRDQTLFSLRELRKRVAALREKRAGGCIASNAREDDWLRAREKEMARKESVCQRRLVATKKRARDDRRDAAKKLTVARAEHPALNVQSRVNEPKPKRVKLQ